MFIEESFPLEWMFPHLTPFGMVLKINRQPVAALTDEMIAKDHQYWSRHGERFVGNWITYETPVKELCAFAERTYLRRDLQGFKGDPKFVTDVAAQKTFSKLRRHSQLTGGESAESRRAACNNAGDSSHDEGRYALRQAYACVSVPALINYATLSVQRRHAFEEARCSRNKCGTEQSVFTNLVQHMPAPRRPNRATQSPREEPHRKQARTDRSVGGRGPGHGCSPNCNLSDICA